MGVIYAKVLLSRGTKTGQSVWLCLEEKKGWLFMRRFLLIVAMLSLVAAPAMATITVRANQHQPANVMGQYTGGRFCNAIDINYTCSDPANEKVRAFALEVTLDPASGFTFSKCDTYKVGESNATSKGFGIFPGKFRDFIDPAAPNWADGNYTPIAPATDADATGTGIGTNKGFPEEFVDGFQ